MEGNYVIRKAETKDVGDIFKMASRVAIDHSERMTVDVRTVTKEGMVIIFHFFSFGLYIYACINERCSKKVQRSKKTQ